MNQKELEGCKAAALNAIVERLGIDLNKLGADSVSRMNKIERELCQPGIFGTSYVQYIATDEPWDAGQSKVAYNMYSHTTGIGFSDILQHVVSRIEVAVDKMVKEGDGPLAALTLSRVMVHKITCANPKKKNPVVVCVASLPFSDAADYPEGF